jgi:hypothetical protein
VLLFPKQLLLDSDPMELARVKLILDRHKIPYEVKTTVSDNALSRSFNAAAAIQVRTGYSAMDTQSYIYRLSVSRRDYARAKELAYGKK